MPDSESPRFTTNREGITMQNRIIKDDIITDEEYEMTAEEREEHIQDYQEAVDRVVTGQIYTLAERLPVCNFGEVISQLRGAAIQATLDAKTDLAAILIQLSAELRATVRDDTIECAPTRPSKAIKALLAL
jgi:hypothetical protein